MMQKCFQNRRPPCFSLSIFSFLLRRRELSFSAGRSFLLCFLLPLFFLSQMLVSGCASRAENQNPENNGKDAAALSGKNIEEMSLEELQAYLRQKDAEDKAAARKNFWKNYKERKAQERAEKLDVTKSHLEEGSSSDIFPWRKDSSRRSETLNRRGSVFYDW